MKPEKFERSATPGSSRTARREVHQLVKARIVRLAITLASLAALAAALGAGQKWG